MARFAITPTLGYNYRTMKRKNIWVDPEIWEQALVKAKADRRDFIVILRRLLELWVKGEIDLKL